jgi:hypothetical protein
MGFFAVFGVDKDRELGDAQAEIKALRLSESLREKAVEEVIYHSLSVFCCVILIFWFQF